MERENKTVMMETRKWEREREGDLGLRFMEEEEEEGRCEESDGIGFC